MNQLLSRTLAKLIFVEKRCVFSLFTFTDFVIYSIVWSFLSVYLSCSLRCPTSKPKKYKSDSLPAIHTCSCHSCDASCHSCRTSCHSCHTSCPYLELCAGERRMLLEEAESWASDMWRNLYTNLYTCTLHLYTVPVHPRHHHHQAQRGGQTGGQGWDREDNLIFVLHKDNLMRLFSYFTFSAPIVWYSERVFCVYRTQ